MPPIVGNLLQSNPGSALEEIHVLLQTKGLRIERIVSHGQPSPEGLWYDQPNQEWVVLLKGTATLTIFDEGSTNLKAGDYLLIPARSKHRVERTSADALWLAVHLDAKQEHLERGASFLSR